MFARVDGRGREPVPAAVPRQEDEPHLVNRARQELIRRLAPGRIDRDPLRLLQRADLVETGSAEDADHPFTHAAHRHVRYNRTWRPA